jgi:hypothetical protein
MIYYSGAESWAVLSRSPTIPIPLRVVSRRRTILLNRIAIVVALLMVSVAGFAQSAKSGDLFLGYSFNRASTGWSSTGNLNGWNASIEGKIAPWAGLVADVGTQYGTLQLPTKFITGEPGSAASTTRVESLMFGPRVSVSKGKFRPFAQALVGVAHVHEDAQEFAYGESSVADAFGGGVDYRLRPQIAWRVQGDALQTRFHGERENDIRISTGLVLNF